MALATGMPAPDQHSLIKKTFFMKHLFFALCILTATSAFTLVACSKKDGFLKDETPAVINHTNRALVRDTPYGKIVTPIFRERTASDTPYGRYSAQTVNGHSIK
jgi:hypothetical protein